ncbi:MAG: FAD/NAD(P)-binding protein [Methyloceanibacter sp.]
MQGGKLDICVIGGGFTGAVAAIACLKRLEQPLRLSVIEPSPSLGRGVAFGGDHPLHLLNVRARDLSVQTDRPRDFLNWAFRQIDQGENDPRLHEGLAHAFLPRQLFGEYVRQRLFEAAENRGDVAFAIVNDAAVFCSRRAGRFLVHTGSAGTLDADVVILATAYGMRTPSATGGLAPYDPVSREQFSKAKSIALIGSGLTMVDVLLASRRDGFTGKATVISRRGQLPKAHASKGVVPQEVGLPQSKSLSRLTGAIRIACEAAERHGTPWQAIVNGLRPSLQDIWQGLPIEEQARFLRHVRPFWDTHRHRLPGEVHERIQAEFNEGRAALLRGRVIDVARAPEGFVLTLQRRGSVKTEIVRTDLAFDCTGHRPDLRSPLLQSLLDQGFACTDPHRLGLRVKRNGQVLKPDLGPMPGLYALGPLGQGSLWEITAVPEIVRQADAAAARIAALIPSGDRTWLSQAS